MKGRLLAAALVSAAAAAPLEAHKPTKTAFTYHRDVRPIFERRCASCHREGGAGPMSLLDYRQTFPWAVAIKSQVLSLSMPPWFADEREGAFLHSSSLTAGEVNTIVDWCLGGTPEGDPAEAPARAPDRDSSLETDLLLPLPEPFVLEAARKEARHEAHLETGLRQERFLRSIALRPESPNVVRSALFYVVPGTGEPGVPVASWIAGDGEIAWPEGKGLRLPRGALLQVVIHYRKTWLDEGKEIRDRSSVALTFAKERARPVESLVVEARGRDGDYRLSRDVEVLSLIPRLSSPADSFEAEAVLPDGKGLILIRLHHPDPGWPRTYRLGDPISLPKGSLLRITLSSPQEASLVLLGAMSK